MAALRVLSYNIHKGFSLAGKRFVLGQIKDALQLVGPDLVFLQEVLGEHRLHATRIENWPKAAQAEFLASRFWPHVVYGKAATYEEGHHGNAILSRHKIVCSENFDVSAHRFESRGLLHVQLNIPQLSVPLHSMCIHFGLTRRWREKQLNFLVKRIKHAVPADEPLIVAGDFNDWSEEATHVLTDKAGLAEVFHSVGGRHARTYPSRLPVFKLDRIYARGLKIENARVLSGDPWAALSDHAPLYAELS